MKRKYPKLVMASLELDSVSPILTGSVTEKKIAVQTVEVEPYTAGFGTDEEIASGRDFKEISFN